MDKMDKLYQSCLNFTNDMIAENGPLEVAAIMSTQALSIYKTVLTDTAYNKMVDVISDSRNTIKSFTIPTLQ